MKADVLLSPKAIDPAELLADFTRQLRGAGAVVSFSGYVRGNGQQGDAVSQLVLETYRGVTLASMEGIAADACARFAVSRCLVVHRCGTIKTGDAIVFVAAASPHRRAAFEAADYLMDRLKTDAVIWKREDCASGNRWIEPRAADRLDRARWDDNSKDSNAMTGLTHLDSSGRATMVDISGKPTTARRARAAGHITCGVATLALVRDGKLPKGGVGTTAEIAGIMAAKRTADLIPLCHPLPLSKVEVEVAIDESLPGLTVHASVATEGRTGAEMEALTAVSVACLTLFDMLKAVDRDLTIGAIKVLSKEGGKSGAWQKP